jgi:phospholipid-transporting ATPase
MGVFDQFISARLLDRYPQLYQLGQKGEFVLPRNLWSLRSSISAVSGRGF